ncbi:MAG TPA: CpsB/CapC family capsule biosynthesis tyrosine phosphatase, partial [Clostridia bacterium]|nr:CpsB/CapC family capsule biosynthesis tyrosine phosphatase [Clostridia bacterium]
MIDLHCHILPQLDDGPGSTEEAVKIAQMEAEEGVGMIAATPHFSVIGQDMNQFSRLRKKAIGRLSAAVACITPPVKMIEGAEVALCTQLLDIPDPSFLCYQGTRYMLVEFPPEPDVRLISYMIYQLRLREIIPVIAHIERYGHFIRHPNEINGLIEAGSVIQINASGLLSHGRGMKNNLMRLIDHNMVHLIATDAHSLQNRPPLLRMAMSEVSARLGNDSVELLN